MAWNSARRGSSEARKGTLAPLPGRTHKSWVRAPAVAANDQPCYHPAGAHACRRPSAPGARRLSPFSPAFVIDVRTGEPGWSAGARREAGGTKLEGTWREVHFPPDSRRPPSFPPDSSKGSSSARLPAEHPAIFLPAESPSAATRTQQPELPGVTQWNDARHSDATTRRPARERVTRAQPSSSRFLNHRTRATHPEIQPPE